MRVVLATLVLNEMEWIGKLYEQHKSFPKMLSWVFVEAADEIYRRANPSHVSNDGLSVDGTTEFLEQLQREDDRVIHIKHGITSHPTDPAQGKIAARRNYFDVAAKINPDSVLVLDADEFYSHDHQWLIGDTWDRSNRGRSKMGFIFKQRHIWKPDLSPEPLFSQEVVGGYWDIPHTRLWTYTRGMNYTDNHNTPGNVRLMRMDQGKTERPQCIHMGFASSLIRRAAKHNYYIQRGEGVTDKRQMYVDCRAAFETWTPGTPLPHKARVISYHGPKPEAFSGKS